MARESDELTSEVASVKRLLILLLMKLGTSQQEIAKALGVSQPSVSRMMPRKIERLKK